MPTGRHLPPAPPPAPTATVPSPSSAQPPTPASTEDLDRARRRTWPARLSGLLVNSVVLLAATAFLTLAIGPHLLGYRTVTMRSGSMQPLAAPGDLLIVVPQPVRDVRVGQVLTFTAPLPDAPVLTHRVLSVEHRDDGPVITTQGDANPSPDPWQARLTDATAWHLVAVLPGAGSVVAALHRPAVHLLAVWLLPAWLCVQALRALWRQPTPEPGPA